MRYTHVCGVCGLFSWSMAAGLLAFSSRQFALPVKHGPSLCPLHTIFPSWACVAGGVCRPRSEAPCMTRVQGRRLKVLLCDAGCVLYSFQYNCYSSTQVAMRSYFFLIFMFLLCLRRFEPKDRLLLCRGASGSAQITQGAGRMLWSYYTTYCGYILVLLCINSCLLTRRIPSEQRCERIFPGRR